MSDQAGESTGEVADPPADLASSGHHRDALAVRVTVHLVGGEAGRALAAAQGRALRDLLAFLDPVEVGQGEEK